MSETLIPIRPEIAEGAYLTEARHREWTAEAAAEPASFWSRMAHRIDWIEPSDEDPGRRFQRRRPHPLV